MKPLVQQNIEAFVDGWQAYCAGMNINDNPYKPFSQLWKYWRGTYLKAKEDDKKGLMPYKRLLWDYKKLPASKYFKKHKK